MSKVHKLNARQILDSRGNPTIEVDVVTEQGNKGRACVPSGASTGKREALELRDEDPNYYMGKSVNKAIHNIENVLGPALIGKEVKGQRELDSLMLEIDGTEFKTNLGANSLLACSLALCKAASLDANKPLYRYLYEDLQVPNKQGRFSMPYPLMNIINGGKHASNNLNFQEFMIVPTLDKSFAENLRAGVEIFHNLKKVLTDLGYSTNVGDEGGFAPNLQSHDEALECIVKATERAGYKVGTEVLISLDCAASEFFEKGSYQVRDSKLSANELIDYYSELESKYPLYSIEDGLDEGDYDGWKVLNNKLGKKLLTVGDDLFVTNQKILKEGMAKGLANSILVKVNQIGTLSETFDTLQTAFDGNMDAIISHRSGETADTFIADLAVACGCGHIKTGSASRSDRVEKYNQLLRIEEELGGEIFYGPR